MTGKTVFALIVGLYCLFIGELLAAGVAGYAAFIGSKWG